MKQPQSVLRTFRFALPLAGAVLFSSTEGLVAETPTVPVGYVTLTAAAGTGTGKKVTAISLPLYDPASADGQMTGGVSSVTANSIVNLSAGWTPGQLSAPAEPYLIKITSGAAAGRTFLISTASANTSTAVTIDAKDAAQADLTTLGIAAGDTYEIYACDTLSGLFGTPATTGVLGGTSANYADSLVIYTNGLSETFYYNTTLNRWTKSALGNPDASNAPIRPDAGILYSRLASTDLVLALPGRVSTTNRASAVKISGVTLLSQNWPVSVTLLQSNFQQIPTWTANADVAFADKVQIVTNGNSSTYWFDGTHWRKQALGSPVADDEAIPAGCAVTLQKLGTQSGYGILTQTLPYPLE